MIREGKDEDREDLMQMWKLCFPQDTERFIRFYFDKIHANGETLVYEANGSPVASLQMIPFRLQIGDFLSWGGYISGAMTHPDHRKKGYMAQLLQASFDEMNQKGYDYTFLIPQEKWLVGLYEKYGFRLCKPSQQPPKNKVLKSSRQWYLMQEIYFEENGILLSEEPLFPKEQKGMIKRLNPDAEEITSLYMGMMFD